MFFPAAIFDCDDTLLDSMWMWRRLVPEVLARYTDEDMTDFCARHETTPMVVGMSEFVEEHGPQVTVDELCEDMIASAQRHYETDIHAFPGAAAFVEQCRDAGIRLAVASCTEPAPLRAGLDANGLTGYFDVIVSAGEGFTGKDEPAIFCATAERLGASPAETVVFEDSPRAAATAKAAGFPVVGVAWTPEQADALASVADLVITDGWPSVTLDQVQEALV